MRCQVKFSKASNTSTLHTKASNIFTCPSSHSTKTRLCNIKGPIWSFDHRSHAHRRIFDTLTIIYWFFLFQSNKCLSFKLIVQYNFKLLGLAFLSIHHSEPGHYNLLGFCQTSVDLTKAIFI